MLDIYQEILNKSLIPTEDQAAATVTGTGIDCTGYYGWAKVTLDSAAMSTGDTLTLTIQDGLTLAGSYAAITVYDTPGGSSSAFTVVTDAAASKQDRYIDLDGARAFVRALGTLAGTSILASFSVTMTVIAKSLPGS